MAGVLSGQLDLNGRPITGDTLVTSLSPQQQQQLVAYQGPNLGPPAIQPTASVGLVQAQNVALAQAQIPARQREFNITANHVLIGDPSNFYHLFLWKINAGDGQAFYNIVRNSWNNEGTFIALKGDPQPYKIQSSPEVFAWNRDYYGMRVGPTFPEWIPVNAERASTVTVLSGIAEYDSYMRAYIGQKEAQVQQLTQQRDAATQQAQAAAQQAAQASQEAAQLAQQRDAANAAAAAAAQQRDAAFQQAQQYAQQAATSSAQAQQYAQQAAQLQQLGDQLRAQVAQILRERDAASQQAAQLAEQRNAALAAGQAAEAKAIDAQLQAAQARAQALASEALTAQAQASKAEADRQSQIAAAQAAESARQAQMAKSDAAEAERQKFAALSAQAEAERARQTALALAADAQAAAAAAAAQAATADSAKNKAVAQAVQAGIAEAVASTQLETAKSEQTALLQKTIQQAKAEQAVAVAKAVDAERERLGAIAARDKAEAIAEALRVERGTGTCPSFADGTIVRNSAKAIYKFDNGALRLFPTPEIYKSWGSPRFAEGYREVDLNACPKGPPMELTCPLSELKEGDIVLDGSEGTLYKVSNKSLRKLDGATYRVMGSPSYTTFGSELQKCSLGPGIALEDVSSPPPATPAPLLTSTPTPTRRPTASVPPTMLRSPNNVILVHAHTWLTQGVLALLGVDAGRVVTMTKPQGLANIFKITEDGALATLGGAYVGVPADCSATQSGKAPHAWEFEQLPSSPLHFSLASTTCSGKALAYVKGLVTLADSDSKAASWFILPLRA